MKTSPKSAYMNCKELDVFTCVWIIGSWSTFTRKDYTSRKGAPTSCRKKEDSQSLLIESSFQKLPIIKGTLLQGPSVAKRQSFRSMTFSPSVHSTKVSFTLPFLPFGQSLSVAIITFPLVRFLPIAPSQGRSLCSLLKYSSSRHSVQVPWSNI